MYTSNHYKMCSLKKWNVWNKIRLKLPFTVKDQVRDLQFGKFLV